MRGLGQNVDKILTRSKVGEFGIDTAICSVVAGFCVVGKELPVIALG